MGARISLDGGYVEARVTDGCAERRSCSVVSVGHRNC